MAAGISVVISGVDHITATIDKINARMAAFSGGIQKQLAPYQASVENAQRSLKKFADQSGLTKVAKGFGDVARGAQDAFYKIGQVVGPLGAITGAASLAGMYRMAQAWADWGTKLGFAAQRIGIGADQLNAFQGAAKLAGVSSEAMTSGLQSLGQTMYDAIGGRAPQATAMFNALGVSFRDGAGHARSVTDVMPEVADKIAAIKDPYTQAQIATTLFGGAAEQLLPFLRRGSAGMREYTEMAQKYAPTTKEATDAAFQLQQAQAKLELSVTGLGHSISEQLAPIIGPLLTQLADWIAANRDLIAQDVGQVVQKLAEWLRSINWEAIAANVRGFAEDANAVAQALGGWQPVIEGFIAFMGARWAIGVIAPVASLAAEIAKVLVKLGALTLQAIPAAVRAFGGLKTAAVEAEAASAGAAGGGAAGALGVLGKVAGTAAIAAPLGFAAADFAHSQDAAHPWLGAIDDLTRNTIRGVFGMRPVAAQGRQSTDGTTQTRAFDTTLNPQARGLLDTIAGTESPGYNVEYGGKRFNDFSHHPNEANAITSGPNAGQASTAAGRYQFLKSTWDQAQSALGLKDFSPASQDKAAWWLAQRDYNARTGRDLAADLQSNDPKVRAGIGAALHSTWTSLPGGIEAGTNTDRFTAQLTANTQREASVSAPVAAAPKVQIGDGSGLTNADLQRGMDARLRVDINHSNVPPGTTASVASDDDRVHMGSLRIARAMPGDGTQ